MQNETQGKSATVGILKRELYFPTLIYFQDLPESRELNEGIRSYIYKLRSDDPDGIVRSNVRQTGAWHSGLDLHQREDFRLLSNRILVAAQQIFDELGYDPKYEAAYDNMWANVSPRYGYNRNHIHPNVLWSGVYYVQAPRNSGRIVFTDPRAQALIVTPRYVAGTQRKAENWSEVYFDPIEGRVIFFPAWLTHEVEPNVSEFDGPDGDRISISFNLLQRRRNAA